MISLEVLSAPSGARAPHWGLDRIVLNRLRRKLKTLEAGSLTLALPGGTAVRFSGSRAGPDASLHVLRWRGLLRMLADGDVGLAQAYMDGDCTTPDLVALLDFATCNEASLAEMLAATGPMQWVRRGLHARRANTRRGSRRNIADHYDLGNAFYSLWLDRGMNYSSALYQSDGQSLDDAQNAKLDRVIALLDPKAGDRVLEIGCGWGALAERLAETRGCHVTGLTLSREQLAFSQERLHAASLAQPADLRLQDYRDVEGCYDRIVSIEMIEAVGERYWPAYFDTIRRRLREGGAAVIQVITIAETRFADYRRRPDFIQRFVFPGGMLPTKTIVEDEARRAGLHVNSQEAFGASYARTCAAWRQRFLKAWPQIEPLGFDLRFKRLWEYYLAYCEVGFRHGVIDVSLVKLVPAVSPR